MSQCFFKVGLPAHIHSGTVAFSGEDLRGIIDLPIQSMTAKMQLFVICGLSVLALVEFAEAAPQSYRSEAMEDRAEKEGGTKNEDGFFVKLIKLAERLTLAPIRVPLEVFNFILQHIPIIGRFFTPA
ncbi:uncharacterized protein ISCGN_029436 [Ixodes scapularis]